MLSCADCGNVIHPPAPVCACCRGENLTTRKLSGHASVYAFTVNRHQWLPGMAPPYVVAIVELLEQPNVRLTTNVVRCKLEEVHAGMAVDVVFDRRGDWWVPLFEPSGQALEEL